MTVAEARDAIARSPKFWRMALVEGSNYPLLEAESTEVQLFEKKKDAQDALREREEELKADGYIRKQGARSKGFIELRKGDSMIALGLDYKGRV